MTLYQLSPLLLLIAGIFSFILFLLLTALSYLNDFGWLKKLSYLFLLLALITYYLNA